MSELLKLRVNQIRVGDVLIRENDHLDRGDQRLEVVFKSDSSPLHFRVLEEGRSIPSSKYGYELSRDGFDIIERNGVRIGTFCVRYW